MYKIIPLFIFSITMLASCDRAGKQSEEAVAIPVHATLPEIKDMPIYIETIGKLEASYFVEIRPQVGGVLEKIYQNEGALIERNEPLFKIEDTSYLLKVDEAKAQVLADQADFTKAEKKLARYRSLTNKNLVAQVEWDELEMQEARARASLAASTARLKGAIRDLDHCTVYSPAKGKIGRIDLSVGTNISPDQLMTTLLNDDPMTVNFYITEKEFAALPKQELCIAVEALCQKGLCATGCVTFLDSQFDALTGLLFTRGEIPNGEKLLASGQNVTIKIPVANSANVLVIPQKAVKYNQQGPYVYVIAPDQSVEFRQLVLGRDEGEEVIVTEGLDPTEQVIISSHGRLSPGLKVEVQS